MLGRLGLCGIVLGGKSTDIGETSLIMLDTWKRYLPHKNVATRTFIVHLFCFFLQRIDEKKATTHYDPRHRWPVLTATKLQQHPNTAAV